jgi:cell division septum initiation protein DivIVA
VSTSGKDNLRKELEETKAEVLKLKQMNKSLRRSVQTAKDAKAKLKDRYTKQIHTLQLEKKEVLSKFIESLPAVPAALFKVILQKKKKG